MSPAERIYGSSSPNEERARSEDRIDDRVMAYAWRQETESAALRANRYNTAKIAAFGWSQMDKYREWQRHRGAAAMLQ